MEAIQKLEQNVENSIKPVLSNPYVMAVLKVTLILYASQLAPKLPIQISQFFDNTFVKMLAVFLIVYITQVDFQLALLLAIVFVIGSNVTSGRKLLESYGNNTGNVYRSIYNQDYGPFYTDKTKYETLLQEPALIGTQKLIESSSDNYSGCNDIKMADLLAIFDNDNMKMQNTVQYAFQDLMKKLSGTPKDNLVKIAYAVGYPYNLTFTDENASLLATMLINYGYVITPSCQPPNQDNMINSTPEQQPHLIEVSSVIPERRYNWADTKERTIM